MVCCRLTSASLVTVMVLAGCASASAGGPRALLELFTSQGCSSCPAADKLLGELAADPSLVVLSVPIDYWDYLGVEDHLGGPAPPPPPARLRARPRRSASLHAANRRQRRNACRRQRP